MTQTKDEIMSFYIKWWMWWMEHVEGYVFNPLSPHDALKHHFISLQTHFNFPKIKGFRTKISMKLVYQYMSILFNFKTTSNHLHPLQVENCDSNSRLVVDEDDDGKPMLERVKYVLIEIKWLRNVSNSCAQLIWSLIWKKRYFVIWRYKSQLRLGKNTDICINWYQT